MITSGGFIFKHFLYILTQMLLKDSLQVQLYLNKNIHSFVKGENNEDGNNEIVDAGFILGILHNVLKYKTIQGII